LKNVPARHRDGIELAKLAEGFWHITMHFGFIQVPDIPAALRQAKNRGCPIDLEDAIYFGGRDADGAAGWSAPACGCSR
jgi:K+ transporter